MKIKKAYVFTIIFLHLLMAVSCSRTGDIVNVSSFGLKPDSGVNSSLYMKKILDECRRKTNPILVFPKGGYDFRPEGCEKRVYFESNTTDNNPKNCAIVINNFKNLTIEGSGSEFIFHGPVQPFTVDNSRNIVIKNLSVDWEVPLTAQAEIIDVKDKYIDLRISQESPYVIEKGKIFFMVEQEKKKWWEGVEFDRDTRMVAYRSDDDPLGRGWYNYRAEEPGNGTVRLFYDFVRKPQKGNILVMRHSARDHAGIFLFHSKNIKLENLNIYHTAGLGVLSQFTEEMEFKNIRMIPNRKKGRYFGGHDDGFHFSNCRGRIIIDRCDFAGLMDDPINVHGTSVRLIKKISDVKILCRFMHNQSEGLLLARPGEKIKFIENRTMQTIGTGVVKFFEKISTKEFRLTFTKSIPEDLKEGDGLENLSWTPDVIIKNSFLGSGRARGILISTPGKVVIENNVFESSGSAILIPGDANYWYESGAVRDVKIKNNRFSDACLTSMYQFCEGIISIDPEISDLHRGAEPFHKNISITGNTFHVFDYPVLFAKSTGNIKFENNIIKRSYRFRPFHYRKHMLTFEACTNVSVKSNKFEGDVLSRNIGYVKMDSIQIKYDKSRGSMLEKIREQADE